MPRGFSRSLRFLFLIVATATGPACVLAQTQSQPQLQSQPAPRITQPINDAQRVTLQGNVHPLAQPRYDRGIVPDAFPATRMFLLLQRAPEQESALRRFIQDEHTPANSNFHKWLTPEQFAASYGPQDSDVTTITAWLQAHGFSVARVTKGKTTIEFSGSAGQIRQTFHTEIHTYQIHGETHHANNADPQIPAALAPVISGITPMNDFRPTSNLQLLGRASYNPQTHKITPQWTLNSGVFALAPGDFALQYDLNPLYTAGLTGTGVTIGIIGASNIDPTVFANYRSFFGLPPGTLNVVTDGLDSGEGNFATGESYLDVEVSGAVAPGATITLYTAADTSVQSGLLLAAQRAVDDDQAPVLSTSYGTCEQALGSSGNQFWAALWEQAAAQGQSSFVSAGDGGSAGCDNFDNAEVAQLGLAVNGFSSTPWNISVGGTDFFYSSYNGSPSAQTAQLSTYWNMTPTDLPATSLLQPVPEQPWNRPFGLNLTTGGVFNTNQSSIVGGSGGASSCVTGVGAPDGSFSSCAAGYAKPAWQSGKGVPADSVRDIPDVSLFAAAGENDSFYPVCEGTDECVSDIGNFFISAVGGTSASSPEMAGIMALINQKYGRQGQANFILYPLAAQHPSAFHDIAVGSNNVPCAAGTLDCSLSSLKDNTNGVFTLGHYYSTAGYDQATGLGSVDANLLVQNWNSLSFKTSNTTLTLNETSFTHGTPVQINVAVAGTGGTPSGDVGLATTAAPAINTGLSELTLQAGAASSTVNNLPGGQYQLTAKYTGDTIFSPSNSTPVTVDVAPEASAISLTGSYWSNASNSFLPVANGASFPYGTYITLDAQPVGVNAPHGGTDGIATGAVTFTAVAAAPQNSGPVNLNSKGIAEWVPALTFPTGANSVSASYPGDPSFKPSSASTPLAFTITKAQTFAFLVVNPSAIALGSVVPLLMQVSATYDGPLPAPPASAFTSSSPAAPTGTTTFTFGTTVLGTATMLPSFNNLYESSASLNVTSLPLGSDTITAAYSGDSNYSAATSTFTVIVEQPTVLSASANPPSINMAEFTAITAAVTPASGMPVPTGTVTFFAVGPGSDWTDSETLKNGSTTSREVVGSFFDGLTSVPVTVSYSGDSTYGPETAVATITITPGSSSPFTLSATSISIAPGAITGNTSTITATPQNGFTGAVFFSCALTSIPAGAVNLPTCNVPPSVNLSSAAAVTAVMTVNSTAPTTSALLSPPRNRPFTNSPFRLAANAAALLAALLSLGMLAQRRSYRRFASFLFVVAMLGALAACGGGGSRSGGGGGGGSTIPGTTVGTYTFTVGGSFTANGAAQAQATVTVTIQ